VTLFGKEHVDRYRETDGQEGHEWKGTTVLLLTTTGRRSGEQRTTPLIYQLDGDDRYVIVASQGGAPTHPGWYHNIADDPNVEVQVWGDRFSATASTAEGEERERLWKVMTATWPAYDDYQARTDREIPVVVLTRA
jgi:deazaflavin-dependent oxidoreductase (nitroreductase family)